jgi:protein-S-isoprenylcysteine O-methyltransferase Ste14
MTSAATSKRVTEWAHPSVQIRRRLFNNLLPALLFGATAAARGLGLLISAQRPVDPEFQVWLSHLLNLAHQSLSLLFLTLITLLFLTRDSPRGGRAGLPQMTVALLGTFIMNVAILQPATTQDWRVLALADLLLTVGLAFTLWAAASLKRCFGIAPEARGLVATGAYRLVRHPMYLGEFVAFLGLLLPVLGPFTLMIFVVFCLIQASRAALEERALGAAFPEYADYRGRTPAVLPWPR